MLNFAILSNINLDLLRPEFSSGTDLYRPSGYGLWVQEIVDSESGLFRFEPHIVFIILDAEELLRGKETYAEMKSELEEYGTYIERALKRHESIYYFVSNLDFPVKRVRSLKEAVVERDMETIWSGIMGKFDRYKNFCVFDLKRLVEEYGRKAFYSPTCWYLGGMKYSMQAVGILQTEIERYVRAYRNERKKCLVLDLDNTLWGKVLGEEGLAGIELAEFKEGARFKDFQKVVKQMKERGIILAVISKNNEADVKRVFFEHPHMVLKEEDFVSLKVNWEHKYRNMQEILAELNIGEDTLVFIDDNPVERESIKTQLTGVTVPGFPGDTAHLESFLIDVYRDHFLTLECTEEDKNKTVMYRRKIRQVQERENSGSYEEFLKNLNTHIYIRRIKDQDVKRACQLTRKTNQFNFTTRRYTEKEIIDFKNSPEHDVYIAAVTDKFGDNGNVALIILKRVGKKIAELDTFLMSCRVMGRFIEDSLVDFIETTLSASGVEELNAVYYPTARNQNIENFFDRLGYRLTAVDGQGGKHYSQLLNQRAPRKNIALLSEIKED